MGGNSRFCVFYVMLFLIPVAMLGINLSALNTSAPAIRVFINESYYNRYGEAIDEELANFILRLAQSIIHWGAVIGAFLVPLVLKFKSRKQSVLCIHLINTVSVILMGLIAPRAKSFEALIVGRFVIGVTRGLAFSIPSVTVAEVTCQRRLGLLQSPYAITTSLSICLGAILGHHKIFGTPELWPWIFSVPAMSSAIFFAFYYWIPDTPVMLLRQKKEKEAYETLKMFRDSDHEVDKELEELQNIVKEEPNRQPLTLWAILKSSHGRLIFVSSLIIMGSHSLTGGSGVTLHSDYLLEMAGVAPDSVSFVTIGIYSQSIVAYIIYLFLQRRIGTKKIFIAGMSILTTSLVIFTVSNILQESISWMSYLALAALCTTMFGNRLGPQLTMHSLSAELTTAQSRPAVAFCGGLSFFASGAVTGLVLPYSVRAAGGYAYIPYIILGLFVIAFVAIWLPDTYNRTSDQIQEKLKQKAKMCSVHDSEETHTYENNAFAISE